MPTTVAMTDAQPSAVSSDKLPPQTVFIVGNEACERFSFYGMRAILTMYMTSALLMSTEAATEIGHLFICGVYLTPVVGAWLADRWLGRYRTILYVSLIYCLGNIVLAMTAVDPAPGVATSVALSSWPVLGLFAGLILIALGSGGIKPCVSAFVGDQFGPHQQHLLPKIYGLFYWSINFGSFFAFGLLPSIRDNYGYAYAFAVPGVFMALATLIFWLGRHRYKHVLPVAKSPGQGDTHVLRIWWYALWHQRDRKPGQSRIDVAAARFPVQEVSGAKAVAGILMIFMSIPFFWALYDQTCTTWVIQGNEMKPLVAFGFQIADAKGFGAMFLKLIFTETVPGAGSFVFKLDAERMQSINPLLVMLLIPLFTFVLYPWIERLGVRVSPLRRMAVGMLLAAGSFVVIGWLQQLLDRGEQLSIAWQILPYILVTAGEVLLSATGLEFAFSQAPPAMKSRIMSFWLLAVAAGNFLVAAITFLSRKLDLEKGAGSFYFYAILMTVVAGVFIWCATRYQDPVQQDIAA